MKRGKKILDKNRLKTGNFLTTARVGVFADTEFTLLLVENDNNAQADVKIYEV